MRRNETIRIMLALLLASSLSACSRQSQSGAATDADQASAVAEQMAAADASKGYAPAAPAAPEVDTETGVDAAQVSSSAATYRDAQRKFIRTAQAEFRVKDVYRSALAIEDIVAAQGGFVVKNEIGAQTQNVQRRPKGDGLLVELAEYTVRGTLTVRVPSENTQPFLRAIAHQMDFLDRRNFEATDAQFALLRQQLGYQRNQDAQRELGQLAQQGGKLDQKADVIAARGDAKSDRDEALIAQKEFEDKVAFSTITLTLYQLPRIRQTELTDVEAVFQKNSPGFFTRLADALRVGWYGVLDVAIELIKLWPLWLLIALGVIAYRRVRRSRKSEST